MSTNTNLIHATQESSRDIARLIVRFDRSLAKNGISFSKFGEDGDLMFDLVVYFANTYQNNLFSHGKLDVDHFCKTMNYSKSNLLKAHKAPRQFQEVSVKKNFGKLSKALDMPNGKKSEEKEMFFYTVLDNALYRLSDEGVSFRFFAKDENFTNSATTSIKIIKVLNKRFSLSNKAKNKDIKKLSYEFSIDADFIDNLTKYFVNIDLTSVSLLRKSNSVYLYSFLKNLQMDLHSKGVTYTDTIDFDLLVELAQIQVEAPADKKKKLITKLNNIFMKSDLKGSIKFIKKKGTNHSYQPVITFFNNLPKLQSAEYSNQVSSAARVRFYHEVKSYYTTLNRPASEFVGWLHDSLTSSVESNDYITVRKQIQSAYTHVCGESINYKDGRVSWLIKELIVDLTKKLEKTLNK